MVHELRVWVSCERSNFIRLQMNCVSVVVQSWPTAGPFHQAHRKQESQGVHDQFFIYFFAVQDLDWGAVANHPPCELAEWSVCKHMYVWPSCTSLFVLHNVKYGLHRAGCRTGSGSVCFVLNGRQWYSSPVTQSTTCHSKIPCAFIQKRLSYCISPGLCNSAQDLENWSLHHRETLAGKESHW